MSLCHDHHRAQDLTQDTMLRAFVKFEQFQPGTNLVGWLFTILRNSWFTEYRKMGREVSDPDGIVAGMVPVPEGQSAAYDLKVIRKRMRFLNSLQRKSIELVAMNRYQYDEAADMLGVPVGTVKSNVNRARHFLETGDKSSLTEEAEPLPSLPNFSVERVSAMFRKGAPVSEIAAATKLSRSEVMQIIADRKLRRA